MVDKRLIIFKNCAYEVVTNYVIYLAKKPLILLASFTTLLIKWT